MSLFIAAGVLIGALVLAYVFAPLMRRRPVVGAALVAAGLAVTAGLYLLVGTPDALDPARREIPRTLEAAILRLEQELQRDPKQAEGWRLLADAYLANNRPGDAARALARAVELQPRDPDLLAQAAEARALARADRRFDTEALDMLRRALEMDPAHQRAAWFLGVAQRQAGRPADAARTWEALLSRVDESTGAALRAQIQSARADAGLPPLADGAPTKAAGAIRVTVDIAPDLRSRLPAEATVFVIARAPAGPPMPVAVERVKLGDLPTTVELDDADAAMPTRRLSQVGRVEVLARASASGSANATAGDLESDAVPAEPGAKITLRIGQVRR